MSTNLVTQNKKIVRCCQVETAASSGWPATSRTLTLLESMLTKWLAAGQGTQALGHNITTLLL